MPVAGELGAGHRHIVGRPSDPQLALRGQAPGVHRDQEPIHGPVPLLQVRPEAGRLPEGELRGAAPRRCLLYTSDAADDM
eukprot:10802371-Alexandrium_andersonii.AAC.1